MFARGIHSVVISYLKPKAFYRFQIALQHCNRGHLTYLDVTIQIGDELLIFMTHTTTEMCDSHICLLTVPQITLRNQNVTHRQHSQSSNLLWCIKYDWRKPAGHLWIQPNLNTGLDLVLTLHQEVKQLLSVHSCFSEICHQPCRRKSRVNSLVTFLKGLIMTGQLQELFWGHPHY